MSDRLTRHAFLLGVDSYGGESGLKDLHCPSNDVRLLESLFSDPAFGGDPAHTQSHLNLSHDEAERRLYRFLKELGRDDVAVVHFSGHGLQDDSGELYLCFPDTSRDELEITALAVTDLRRMLDKARARKVLVTLDCCYSGAAGGMLTRDDVSSQLHRIEEHFGEGAGVYVLSASSETETAKESRERGAGVFTHHLVEGIRSGAADRDKDGRITVSEIAEYLSREVPKDAARQTPHLWAEKISGTFVVAMNRAAVVAKEAARCREAVRELVNTDAVSLGFAGEVDSWLTQPERLSEPPGERWALLQKLAARELTAGDFQERWRRIERREAAAPPPDTPPREERQQTPRPPPPPAPEAPGHGAQATRGGTESPPVGVATGPGLPARGGRWLDNPTWLFAAEAVALINAVTAFELAEGSVFVDAYGNAMWLDPAYEDLAWHAVLALGLAALIGYQAVRLVAGWRREGGGWRRGLAVAVAPIMVLVSAAAALEALLA